MTKEKKMNEVFEEMKNVKLGDVKAIREVHKMIDLLMDEGTITKQEHRTMCGMFTAVLRGKY